MADISIQFHATETELVDFCLRAVSDFGLSVVAMRFRPFEANEVSADELRQCISGGAASRRLHFTLEKPALPAMNELEFQDKNPNSLRLDVGVHEGNVLTESWLSA